MNSLDSLNSLVTDYESNILNPDGSSGSGSSSLSSILSENGSGGTAINGVSSNMVLEQAENAASINTDNASLQSDQTSALVQFYNYAASVSSTAGTLSSEMDDTSSLNYDDISSFVNAYNNLVSYAGGNTNYISSNALDNLNQNASEESDNLSSIGISENSDGTLSIDESTLQSSLASDPDSVASALGNFVSETQTSAQTITSGSLSDYAANLTDSNNGSTDFYNYVNSLSASSVTNSLLGQFIDTNS